jgi:hypothetical protein
VVLRHRDPTFDAVGAAREDQSAQSGA